MSETPQHYLEAWTLRRDQFAGERLVEHLYPQVARIVQNHLPRNAAVEDLAQEVFVQFFRTADRIDRGRPLEKWVSRLAVNVCLNALRSRRRRPEWRFSDLAPGEQALVETLLLGDDSAGDGQENSHARELLSKLLERLAPQDRMLLSLLYLEEKTSAEVADLTGWDPTLIKVRAFRARAKLKKEFALLSEVESKRKL
jgi:RNA polymerase sigma-70 factor (ECF subfamily)